MTLARILKVISAVAISTLTGWLLARVKLSSKYFERLKVLRAMAGIAMRLTLGWLESLVRKRTWRAGARRFGGHFRRRTQRGIPYTVRIALYDRAEAP